MILDLFGGPGGWSEGLRLLGLSDVAIEWDAAACATAAAAGHATIRADVAAYPTEPFAGKVEGLIASPPCPDWSVAGKGAGMDGVSGHLVREVPRWVEALRPRWVACEQVPPVLPVWRHYAHLFRQLGYSTWTGILSAETFGVPQTRKRAILMASLDRPAVPPEPTHQAYVSGQPARPVDAGLFGDGLLPWVSMADALGWGFDVQPSPTVTAGGTGSGGGVEVFGYAGTRKRLAATVNTRRDQRDDGTTQERPVTEPAPTFTGKSGSQWEMPEGRPTWPHDRPATTIACDPRVSKPGHHDEVVRQQDDAIRITVAEASILQGFDPTYPWQGTRTKQFEQIGNAVPPPLAAAIIDALTGAARQEMAA